VENNPDIDRLWIYSRVRHAGPWAIFQNLNIHWRLRRQRFDWVLVANGAYSHRAVRRALAVRGRRTVAYTPRREVSDALPLAPQLHEMDALLAMLRPLGAPPPNHNHPIWPRYELPSQYRDFARAWLKERQLNEYVVLGLGARRAKKQPTTEQILRWSAHFKQAWSLDTVFMWTPGASQDPLYPGDDGVAQPVLDAAAPQIHPFRGPIREALGLVWGARTSVFPDSGLMHFAAASPGGVLGLFAESAVSPGPVNWAPRGPRAQWLEADKAVAELPDALIYERIERLLQKPL